MWTRFLMYMVIGLVIECTFFGIRIFLTHKPRDLRLPVRTYLWMYPVYGSIVFMFEPIHNAIRDWSIFARGCVYMVGCFAVEYLSGWILKKTTGNIPWDYSYARFHVHSLIRLDYAPAWFVFGLLLERLHDAFVITGPVLKHALLYGA